MLSYKRKRDHLQFALTYNIYIYKLYIYICIFLQKYKEKKQVPKDSRKTTLKKSWKPASSRQTVQFKRSSQGAADQNQQDRIAT